MKHLRNSIVVVEHDISKVKEAHEIIKNLIALALPVIGGPEWSALSAANKYIEDSDSYLTHATEAIQDTIRDIDD